MPKRSVHFILNPVSGSGQNKLNIKFIRSVLNTKNYDFKVKNFRKTWRRLSTNKVVNTGGRQCNCCSAVGTEPSIKSHHNL
jgi:hypothetical protein